MTTYLFKTGENNFLVTVNFRSEKYIVCNKCFLPLVEIGKVFDGPIEDIKFIEVNSTTDIRCYYNGDTIICYGCETSLNLNLEKPQISKGMNSIMTIQDAFERFTNNDDNWDNNGEILRLRIEPLPNNQQN